MAGSSPQDISLETLHSDLTELRADLREVEAALVAGFRSLPGREIGEETVRLLREGGQSPP